ncbi:MAG: tRNA lysidine(34) synthetase TilS [Pseudomonadota bacterium]|nr:tRNA lysidine(34) synthetase TilS [Patescibacteria group bacterium]
MTKLFANFKNNILENKLLSNGERVVASVSGGIDSMVMLDMLVRLSHTMKLDMTVAHANHGLRGKASDADEELVKETAACLNILCEVERLTPPKNKNVQDAARTLRQGFLKRIAKKHAISAVCLGHHQGDQAETILLHLIRGSSLAGLRGMSSISYISELRLVRPMLFASRADIEEYATKRHIAFREDATNLKTCYRRNEIRHTLMPLIRELNPRIETRLSFMAELIAEDDDALEAIAEAFFDETLVSEAKDQISLNRKLYLTMPAAIRRRILKLAYTNLTGSSADLNSDQLTRMDQIALSSHPRGEYRLPAPWQFIREGEFLRMTARQARPARKASKV